MAGPKKVVRFAYANIYHPPQMPPPGLSYSSSTVPSSRGPMTPPDAPLSIPLPYGAPHYPTKVPRFPVPVSPHRYFLPEAILWSLLKHPATSIRDGHHLSRRVLLEPASEPPLPFIQIFCKHLPWTCKVHASNGHYVTVSDVFESLYRSLQVRITQSEFEKLPSSKDKRRATRAYEERYMRLRGKHYQEEKTAGMKRIDFLMGHTHFQGLSADSHQPHEWNLWVS